MAVTLGALVLAIMVAVTAFQIIGARRELARVQGLLSAGLETKGQLLVRSQAVALRGLASDNAFTDVGEVVRRSVEADEGLRYGMFVGSTGRAWVVAGVAPTATEGAPTGTCTSEDTQRVVRVVAGEEVWEYTSAVRSGDACLGTISYGLSTRGLHAALNDAEAGQRSLTTSLLVLLALVLAGLTAVAGLLARRMAGEVTEPLARLTDATRSLADGRLDVRVGLKSGDELELLSDAFDRMAAELESSYQRLEALNRSLEQRVEERTAQLSDTNAELESFSYSVSHDLRAPLRAIDGFSAVILEEHGAVLPKDAREHFERIRRSTARMSELIDDLLLLSRVALQEVHPSDVDLTAMATDVIERLRETAPTRTVTVKVAPDLHAHGDERLLRIVLENLIGNAWKFTSKQDEATIEVGWDDARSAFVVRDDGAGFDMERAEKLFHPFQRLHLPSEFEGTGVGLATVSRVVRRHGGAVWAESKLGHGATFAFTCPRGES